MNYKIEEYPDFSNVQKQHFQEPIFNLVFLPENLNAVQDSSNFIYPESSTDIKKIFRADNLRIEYLTIDKPILRARKSADWFGPTIFIGFSILSENSSLIGISLNLISNYLYDFFKGTVSERKVKFEIVIETNKNKDFKKIIYEGTVDGIKELETVIKELKK